MKLAAGGRLVIATHNPGKVVEMEDLLSPLGFSVVAAGALGLPEPEETGSTFAENAAIKALACATKSGLPALSDDSGLCVEALGGDPGIYSARWAGPSKDFSKAMETVEMALGSNANRNAYFVCALCFALPDGRHQVFEGRIDGQLIWPPRGSRGFGYDPIFMPKGESLTFGEMEPETKHSMSHRAKAFSLFLDALR